MNIHPDKLSRYWTNECSKQETRLVEQWLQAGEPDDIYSIGDDLDQTQLKNELWSLMSLQIADTKKESRKDVSSPPVLALYGRFSWILGLAASLLLVAAFSLYTHSGFYPDEAGSQASAGYDAIEAHYRRQLPHTSQKNHIHYTGPNLKLIEHPSIGNTEKIAYFCYGLDDLPGKASRSLHFYLTSNSSINGGLNRNTYKGFLNVYGSLKVVNNAGKNLELDFGMENTSPIAPKKVKIEDRKVYYVGILKEANRPEEVLVLNSEELEDIPPRIKIMAFNSYTI